MSYDKLCETVKELHEICFNQKDGVIHHSRYSKDFSYKNNYCGSNISTTCFKQPDIITGYCDLCQNCAVPEKAEEKNKFKLSSISHGSHTFDFLEAFGITDIKKHVESWNANPVLFLMENPSLDYGIYDYIPEDKDHKGKRPAKQWYWIHCDHKHYEEFKTNKYLRMSEYGDMVASLIVQFKLANAYLTNIVKCGMSDAEYKEDEEKNSLIETSAKSTWEYQPKCIKTCMEKVLKKEVQALLQKEERITVFAFGGRVYQLAGEFFRNCEFREQVRLFKLPHPAGRMSNDYRRFVLKGVLSEALQVPLELEKAEPVALKKPMTKTACKAVFDEQFKNVCFEGKPVSFNERRTTKSQLGLFINQTNSIFEEETVLDIKLSDNLDRTGKKEIGYVFSSDSYWAWDSGKNKPMECSDFRYFKEFQNCINEILSQNQ